MNGIDLKSVELQWSPPKGLLRGAMRATMQWTIAWLEGQVEHKVAHWSEDTGRSHNVDLDSWIDGVCWAMERLRTGPERSPRAPDDGDDEVVEMEATEEKIE